MSPSSATCLNNTLDSNVTEYADILCGIFCVCRQVKDNPRHLKNQNCMKSLINLMKNNHLAKINDIEKIKDPSNSEHNILRMIPELAIHIDSNTGEVEPVMKLNKSNGSGESKKSNEYVDNSREAEVLTRGEKSTKQDDVTLARILNYKNAFICPTNDPNHPEVAIEFQKEAQKKVDDYLEQFKENKNKYINELYEFSQSLVTSFEQLAQETAGIPTKEVNEFKKSLLKCLDELKKNGGRNLNEKLAELTNDKDNKQNKVLLNLLHQLMAAEIPFKPEPESNSEPSSSLRTGSIKMIDVAILKDPTAPYSKDNIKLIVEVKFPGDSLHENQWSGLIIAGYGKNPALFDKDGCYKKNNDTGMQECNAKKETLESYDEARQNIEDKIQKVIDTIEAQYSSDGFLKNLRTLKNKANSILNDDALTNDQKKELETIINIELKQVLYNSLGLVAPSSKTESEQINKLERGDKLSFLLKAGSLEMMISEYLSKKDDKRDSPEEFIKKLEATEQFFDNPQEISVERKNLDIKNKENIKIWDLRKSLSHYKNTRNNVAANKVMRLLRKFKEYIPNKVTTMQSISNYVNESTDALTSIRKFRDYLYQRVIKKSEDFVKEEVQLKGKQLDQKKLLDAKKQKIKELFKCEEAEKAQKQLKEFNGNGINNIIKNILEYRKDTDHKSSILTQEYLTKLSDGSVIDSISSELIEKKINRERVAKIIEKML